MIRIQGRRLSKRGCSVVGCINRVNNTTEKIKFYSFPNRPWEEGRKEKWIQAVNRINQDGSEWRPTRSSAICSSHFVGNQKSGHPLSQSFLPTIFPDVYKCGRSVNKQNMEFSPKKATTTKKCCSVPQCSSLAERDRNLSFHTFPKENETVRISDKFGNYAATGRRNEWARRLKIGKPVSKCMYVCSKHFTADNFRFPDIPAQKRYLKLDALPSENLPQAPTTGVGQHRTRRLDRRKKTKPPENSVLNVPQCSPNEEESDMFWSKLGRVTGKTEQVEVKAEPATCPEATGDYDDRAPQPILFVKTEVTDDYDDDYGGGAGLDLHAASSYSTSINLGANAKTEDFRFVDVDGTAPATSCTSRAADIDPLELSSAPLPEPRIKQEPPDSEDNPLEPHCTRVEGLHEQMPTYPKIEKPDPIIPQVNDNELVADESYKPAESDPTDSSSDSDKSTG